MRAREVTASARSLPRRNVLHDGRRGRDEDRAHARRARPCVAGAPPENATGFMSIFSRDLQQLGGEMLAGAVAVHRVDELARPRARDGDELLDALRRQRGMDREHERLRAEPRHRDEILVRIVRQLRAQHGVRHEAEARDEHGMAVGRRARDGFRADDRVRAGAVFHDDALAERLAESGCAIARATTSFDPPAANGTTRRTVFEGKSSVFRRPRWKRAPEASERVPRHCSLRLKLRPRYSAAGGITRKSNS